ncbi:MAG: hypothetical protein OEU26_01060 [Candidatus Tectomicrobia bacterium]|nr:hypothetical protein [Candidatus Tectomicrobia bacterium]
MGNGEGGYDERGKRHRPCRTSPIEVAEVYDYRAHPIAIGLPSPD